MLLRPGQMMMGAVSPGACTRGSECPRYGRTSSSHDPVTVKAVLDLLPNALEELRCQVDLLPNALVELRL